MSVLQNAERENAPIRESQSLFYIILVLLENCTEVRRRTTIFDNNFRENITAVLGEN